MIETERLILRRLTASDHEALESLLGNAEVMNSSVDGPLDSEEVATWLSDQIELYETDNGIEIFAVINRATSELIGYCGLTLHLDIDGVPEIEIGYRLIRKLWDSGYATEAAIAIRDYAFTDLKVDRLVALIEPVNKRSIRVSEKLGMEYEKDVMLDEYDYPDHLYAMRK
jgi:RimJ/RimL family protein N-acetyltransferase